MTRRRALIAIALAALLSAVFARHAPLFAQAYPAKPITPIVPWPGGAAPKGMDPKIVQILHDAFKKSLDDPEMIAVFDKFFMVPNSADQKDYLAIIKATTAYEKQALERIGLAK